MKILRNLAMRKGISDRDNGCKYFFLRFNLKALVVLRKNQAKEILFSIVFLIQLNLLEITK